MHDHQRQLASGADGGNALDLGLRHLSRNHQREAVQKVGARREHLGDVLGDVRARHKLVELLEHLRDALRTRLAKARLVEEEIIAEIALRHLCTIDDGERAYPGQHEVLESLRASCAAVEKADGALLHGVLAVLAPQAQLTVVTALFRVRCPLLHLLRHVVPFVGLARLPEARLRAAGTGGYFHSQPLRVLFTALQMDALHSRSWPTQEEPHRNERGRRRVDHGNWEDRVQGAVNKSITTAVC